MAERDAIGRYIVGNKGGPGRVKGSRNEMTRKLLERFAVRNQDGISIEEILFDMAQDTKESTENRFKAAAKLADLVFPKTAQVELEIEDGSGETLEEMNDKIQYLLSQAVEGIVEDKKEDD